MHCENSAVGSEVTTIDLWVEGAVVVPYPAALVEQLDLRSMMTSSGVAFDEGDRLFVSDNSGAINYALRLSAESAAVVDAWRQEGKSVRILSPLMSCVTRAVMGCRRKKMVVITILDGIAYVAYTHEKHLHYAEALPVDGEEELVNLLAHLNQDFDLRKARFTLLGESSERYYKILRQYFRRVRVES